MKKIPGFFFRLIVSFIAAFPVIYWCRNIINETTTADVILMIIIIVGVLISLVISWLIYPLFKN